MRITIQKGSKGADIHRQMRTHHKMRTIIVLSGRFQVQTTPSFEIRVMSLVFLILILAACGADGVSQQTMVAYQTFVSTQRASFYITATVDAERGQVTLNAIQQRIDRALTQRQFMLATLQARGIDTSRLPPPLTPTPVPPSPASDDISNPEATANVLDTPLPTSVIITPFIITPTVTTSVTLAFVATPMPNSPLRDIVMAQGVGRDDCPVGVTNTFSVNSARIYIVARAVGVQSGTRLGSIWQKADGTPLVQFDFTPNFNIRDACIWFFATPDDFPFEAGNYTVILTVNDQVASNPVLFTITP